MATEDDPKPASTHVDENSDVDAAEPNPSDTTSGSEAPPADETEAAPPSTPGDDAQETAEPTPTEVAPASEPSPTKAKGARWAEPIAGFERRWTWLETRLLTFVLVWQLVSLVAWVLLSGIAVPPSSGDASGTTFRCVIAAVILGIGGWVGSRKLPLEKRRAITIAGIAVGVCIGLVLRPPADAIGGIRLAINKALALDRFDAFLVNYFSNIKGWLQDGSTLTLLGGLRGLATRLTLWLALLGASLATAAGKHIHIDIIFRFLPKRLRVPAAIINFSAAATVCVAGSWGFVDHLAIESFNAKAEDTAGAKISQITHHIGQHAFLTRKQIALDLRALPHVLRGETYDRWMSPAEWNQWVKEGGFEKHYKPEEVATIIVPEDSAAHPPLVLSPDGENTRSILVHTLNFVFPFGLIAIALRFLLRAILTISGHITVDPDEAHKEDLHSASNDAAHAGGA